jgi:hypothetical protein
MAEITLGDRFDQWAILELMGHVRMAGRVTEEQRFGAVMGRIDIPNEDGGFCTIYFGGGSVYRLTPTTEAIARSVAKGTQPEPAYRWEMPSLPAPEPVTARYSGPAQENGPDDDESDDSRDLEF